MKGGSAMMVESILLLNASYEPLAVVSLSRAVNLLLRERVEPATDEKLTVQTATSGMVVPEVLRLKHYVNVPHRNAPAWNRRALFARDQFTCAYCGRKAGAGGELAMKELTVDHVIPLSRGGKSSWLNTVCACQRCNTRKGNRLPHEAGMKLRIEPKLPRTNYLVMAGHTPASWKVWLETPF
jgi:5-methylcytosine-specific restriction endonuclease McrA